MGGRYPEVTTLNNIWERMLDSPQGFIRSGRTGLQWRTEYREYEPPRIRLIVTSIVYGAGYSSEQTLTKQEALFHIGMLFGQVLQKLEEDKHYREEITAEFQQFWRAIDRYAQGIRE